MAPPGAQMEIPMLPFKQGPGNKRNMQLKTRMHNSAHCRYLEKTTNKAFQTTSPSASIPQPSFQDLHRHQPLKNGYKSCYTISQTRNLFDVGLNSPIRLVVEIAGGVPTVDKAGPWLLPDTTQTTPYLLTTSDINSPIRLMKL